MTITNNHLKPNLYPCLLSSLGHGPPAMNDNGIKSTDVAHPYQHGSSTWLKAASAFLPVRQRAQLPCSDPCFPFIPSLKADEINYATFGIDHQMFPTLKPAPGTVGNPLDVDLQSGGTLEQNKIIETTTERPNKTTYEAKLAGAKPATLCWGHADKEASWPEGRCETSVHSGMYAR